MHVPRLGMGAALDHDFETAVVVSSVPTMRRKQFDLCFNIQ